MNGCFAIITMRNVDYSAWWARHALRDLMLWFVWLVAFVSNPEAAATKGPRTDKKSHALWRHLVISKTCGKDWHVVLCIIPCSWHVALTVRLQEATFGWSQAAEDQRGRRRKGPSWWQQAVVLLEYQHAPPLPLQGPTVSCTIGCAMTERVDSTALGGEYFFCV